MSVSEALVSKPLSEDLVSAFSISDETTAEDLLLSKPLVSETLGSEALVSEDSVSWDSMVASHQTSATPVNVVFDKNLVPPPLGSTLPRNWTGPITRDFLVDILGDTLQRTFVDKPFKQAVNDGKTHNSTFMFQSKTIPSMTIKQYFVRLAKYTGISGESMILAMVHIARVFRTLPNFPVNALTIHRLLLTSALVSAKFFDDSLLNNARYARVGGVCGKEMNMLEVELLFLIDFNLYVTGPEYVKIYQELVLNQQLFCCSPQAPGGPPANGQPFQEPPAKSLASALTNATTAAPTVSVPEFVKIYRELVMSAVWSGPQAPGGPPATRQLSEEQPLKSLTPDPTSAATPMGVIDAPRNPSSVASLVVVADPAVPTAIPAVPTAVPAAPRKTTLESTNVSALCAAPNPSAAQVLTGTMAFSTADVSAIGPPTASSTTGPPVATLPVRPASPAENATSRRTSVVALDPANKCDGLAITNLARAATDSWVLIVAPAADPPPATTSATTSPATGCSKTCCIS